MQFRRAVLLTFYNDGFGADKKSPMDVAAIKKSLSLTIKHGIVNDKYRCTMDD